MPAKTTTNAKSHLGEVFVSLVSFANIVMMP